MRKKTGDRGISREKVSRKEDMEVKNWIIKKKI